MQYTFSSPVTITSPDGDTIEANREVADIINDRLSSQEPDLAEWLKEDLEMVVACITMEVIYGLNGISCRTTCIVRKELPKGLLNKLSNFITGQFSDGWGEGFEQDEFSINRSEKFYASFWSENNWHLDVVGFSVGDNNEQ